MTNELAGTTWDGNLRWDDDSASEAVVSFSASGNLIFSYQDRNGINHVELSEVGQKVQYIPQGGGVSTVVVKDLVVEPRHVVCTADVSFERTSNGMFDQQYSTVTTEAVLSNGALEVEMTTRSQNTASSSDLMVHGGENASVGRGTLKRRS